MAVLVKFNKDWCDEFDVEHFYARKGVSASEETEKVAAQIDSGEAGFWFGTNEGWEGEEMHIDDYEFIDITDAEFDTLYKLFRGTNDRYVRFGTGV